LLLNILKTVVKYIENGVLRKIFGPMREEIIGGRKLHNEELHDFCSPPLIIRVIKLSTIRWVGHVACTVESKSINS
jgi:hypothetical protein